VGVLNVNRIRDEVFALNRIARHPFPLSAGTEMVERIRPPMLSDSLRGFDAPGAIKAYEYTARLPTASLVSAWQKPDRVYLTPRASLPSWTGRGGAQQVFALNRIARHPFPLSAGTEMVERIRPPMPSERWSNAAGLMPSRRSLFWESERRMSRVRRLYELMDELESELGQSDPTAARLTVLLRHVGVGRALAMMELMLAKGPQPLIDALGGVLLTEQARKIFLAAVRESGLSAQPAEDIEHALEHLENEECDRAFPPLLTGLEGAFRHTARVQGDRRKRSNARAVAAVLGIEKEHELLIGTIYGEANDGRHGEEMDRRAACILALAGLIVWIDFSMEMPAVRWLGRELDQRLTIAP
jgi:hypothetical protein